MKSKLTICLTAIFGFALTSMVLAQGLTMDEADTANSEMNAELNNETINDESVNDESMNDEAVNEEAVNEEDAAEDNVGEPVKEAPAAY